MKTLFIGQNSIHLEAIDSTNSYASEWIRKIKPPEGTLIYTFNQQKGRGQRGNSWESEPTKNAALSFILYPAFLSAERQFLLTKISSLATADLMAELIGTHDKTSDITIKWPNDIYAGNKKIAGILIENTVREAILHSTIAGIGININQLTFHTTTTATSLSLITNKTFDPQQCISRLCEFMEARYLQLKANKLESIDTQYIQRLYQLHEWKDYTTNNQVFKGKITGVSVQGKLQVQLQSDEIKEFDLKEITFTSS